MSLVVVPHQQRMTLLSPSASPYNNSRRSRGPKKEIILARMSCVWDAQHATHSTQRTTHRCITRRQGGTTIRSLFMLCRYVNEPPTLVSTIDIKHAITFHWRPFSPLLALQCITRSIITCNTISNITIFTTSAYKK